MYSAFFSYALASVEPYFSLVQHIFHRTYGWMTIRLLQNHTRMWGFVISTISLSHPACFSTTTMESYSSVRARRDITWKGESRVSDSLPPAASQFLFISSEWEKMRVQAKWRESEKWRKWFWCLPSGIIITTQIQRSAPKSVDRPLPLALPFPWSALLGMGWQVMNILIWYAISPHSSIREYEKWRDRESYTA